MTTPQWITRKYKALHALESALGSPKDSENLFGFDETLKLDEASLFPNKQRERLNDLSVQNYFVPESLGGRLASFEVMVDVLRSIYRRDCTLGLGYGVTTLMAALPVFLAGHPALQKRAADLILSGKTISVAYHEREHGNDLLGNEVRADRAEGGYILTGSKWITNNIAVSAAATVFARISPEGGGRGFGLFFLDKAVILANAGIQSNALLRFKVHKTAQKELIGLDPRVREDDTTISYCPKIKTLGVRGARIAGCDFHQTWVPDSAVIGKVGEGVEMTFKAFQVTRAILPGMSIGMLDTALRCVVDFSRKRVLYGAPMIDIPHVSETLVESFIEMLICDAVSRTASRSLHVIPEQMSVISALSKFYIPTVLQGTLKNLAVILGARHYIRDGEYGIFQKILRDFPVVGVGHASAVICAESIAPQMKSLLMGRIRSENHEALLASIFDLSHPLPSFEINRLKMSNQGRDDIFKSLEMLGPYLEKTPHFKQASRSLRQAILKSLERMQILLVELEAEVCHPRACHPRERGDPVQCASSFVESYAQISAALSCIWLWVFNHSKISSFFDRGIWLILALQRIFNDHSLLEKADYRGFVSHVALHIDALFLADQSFSLVPIDYP